MDNFQHFVERRKHQRKPFAVPIEYVTQDGTGRELSLNISNGGLFFQTSEYKSQLYIGQEILFNIPSKNRKKLIKILGVIVRIGDEGVGVRFKSKLQI